MAFIELIECHKRRRLEEESASPVSRDELASAVSYIVSEHQDLDLLLKELSSTSEDGIHSNTASSTSIISSEVLARSVSQQTELLPGPAHQVAASVIANKLKVFLVNTGGSSELLTDQQKVLVVNIIAAIKLIQVSPGFSRSSFIRTLVKDFSPPIELIWRLHKENIIMLDTYITASLGKSKEMRHLAQSIVSLCRKSAEEENSLSLRSTIVTDFVSYLINEAYKEVSGENSGKGLKKVFSALLASISTKTFTRCDVDILLYQSTIQAGQVNKSVLTKFSTRQLSLLLAHYPNIKVAKAIQSQPNWTFSKSDSYMSSTFTQLLSCLSLHDSGSVLENVLEQQEVNWHHVMVYTACVLNCFPLASQHISGLVLRLVKTGLDLCQTDQLVCGFLLARQACLEGPHIFPAYPDWFYTLFGKESTTAAQNKKSFGFLVKFLTELVPFELPIYLKAHLAKAPFIPSSARQIWSDYTMLARTRLADLKEDIEESIYGSHVSHTDAEVKDSALNDVEKAVMGFVKSDKVPSSVMEASIFRKPYFVGKFLPVLLEPRPLPDNPDGKMKLIEALKVAGKIPASLLSVYEQKCQQMTNQLLEGVAFDEDSMETMIKSPEDQFDDALQSLTQAVIQHKPDVARFVSVVKEKIETMVTMHGAHSNSEDAGTLVPPSLIKVSEAVLNTICSTVAEQQGQTQTIDDCSSSWLYMLLSVICQTNHLNHVFFTRIRQLILSQGGRLSHAHIHGLAGILVTLLTYCDDFSQITTLPADRYNHNHGGYFSMGKTICHGVITSDISANKCHMSEFILSLLEDIKCVTQSQMAFTLKLCSSYIQFSNEYFREVKVHQTSCDKFITGCQLTETKHAAAVPAIIISWMEYLVPRMLPFCRRSSNNLIFADSTSCGKLLEFQSAATIYKSDIFQEFLKENKICLYDWARLEVNVDPNEDILSQEERNVYYHWVIWEHFVGDDWSQNWVRSPKNCVRSLVHALLDSELQCNQLPVTCERCQNCKTERQNRNKHQLLHLIQSFSMSDVSPCHHSNRQVPFVWHILLERLHFIKTGNVLSDTDLVLDIIDDHWWSSLADKSIVVSQEVQNWFELCSCLSPHLIFSDDVVTMETSAVTSKFSCFIRHIIVEYLVDAVALDLSKTHYFTQAIITCVRGWNKEDLQVLFSENSVLLISLAFHWSSLGSALQRQLSGLAERSQKTGMTYLKKVCQEMDHVMLSTNQLLDEKQWHGFHGDNCWMFGMILYKRIIDCGISDSDFVDAMKILCKDTNKIPAMAMVNQCFLTHLANALLQCQLAHNKMEENLLQLWLLCPAVFTDMEQQNTVLLIKACPHRPTNLKPVVCLKLLANMSKSDLMKLACFTGSLSKMIDHYNQCCRLYDNGSLDSSSKLLSYKQVITADLMREFCEKIRVVCATIPSHFVSGISKDVLNECDPVMRSVLKIK